MKKISLLTMWAIVHCVKENLKTNEKINAEHKMQNVPFFNGDCSDDYIKGYDAALKDFINKIDFLISDDTLNQALKIDDMDKAINFIYEKEKR